MGDKVSIIIPIYNAEKTIKRCIDSIRSQRYENIEIILVDDGSNDASGIICDEYASIDNRIVVMHKRNEGVSIARNSGIEISTGDYLLFVDSDDYVSTSYVQNLYNGICDDSRFVMAVGGMIRFGKTNGRFPTRELECVISAEEAVKWLLRGSNIKGWLCNKIYKKEIVAETRLFPGLHYLEDLEFNLRLLSRCKGYVHFISDYDYHYYINENSASHENERRIEGIELFHEVISYLEDNPEKRYRFIRDYLSELRIIKLTQETKAIVRRNISYIRKNMLNCWNLLNTKEKIRCLICSANYPLFCRIQKKRSLS